MKQFVPGPEHTQFHINPLKSLYFFLSNDVTFSHSVSLPAYTALQGLSNCFSDPSWALSLLKSDMKTRISVVKLRTHIEYMRHLISARVGTEDAEKNAMKFVYGGINTWGKTGDEMNMLRNRGVVEEVMRTMNTWERKESRALREKVTEVERHCYNTS